MSLSRFFAALLAIGLALAGAPIADSAAPSARGVTVITGTKAMRAPGTGVANLDAGSLVAGNTKWDPTGTGIVFNDTQVGFLWEAPTAP